MTHITTQLRAIFIFFLLTFIGHLQSEDYVRNPLVSEEIWNKISPYFLPVDHPMKAKLDRIFSKSRAIRDVKSMKKAGFYDPHPYEWSRIVVTGHPDLPGYLIKAYLDKEQYVGGEPEYFYLMLRIEGAQIIQNEIEKRHLQHLFKVPKKWFYPLPDHPSPPKKYWRKNFIIIEEDMDIYPFRKTCEQWHNNPIVNRKTLKALFELIRDLGLADSRPENLPFSRDGRIAFVDTEIFYIYPPNYTKMARRLNHKNREYWETLVKKEKETNKRKNK